ncbi:hypothetical protein AC578_11032 [Pseudocercospora eumusae]|uniref:Enoyl reductase (ER) domain-containing protein n=1 Tax=Pseudocercospora eumusae TaxID=321146 RepID=A0A139HS97_9PEZI|nr:hypothetical protein AC578_11032 [Pseudocercospora eumusae]
MSRPPSGFRSFDDRGCDLVKVDISTGKAIHVDQDGGLRAIPPSHEIRPNVDEVLVKTIYSAITPADTRHGRILEIGDFIVGHDFCGEVWVGRASAERIKHIFVTTLRVPSSPSHQHAAAIGSAVHMAADAVFNLFELSLPLPNERSPGSLTPGPMLIWGASTTSGLCVLQFATAAGARYVFVTASQARHALLLAYGAIDCFDYTTEESDTILFAHACVTEADSNSLYSENIPLPRNASFWFLSIDQPLSVEVSLPSLCFVQMPAPVRLWEELQVSIVSSSSCYNLHNRKMCRGHQRIYLSDALKSRHL